MLTHDAVFTAIAAICAGLSKTPRKLAFGIVLARNESAKPATTQRKTAVLAPFLFTQRAMARILAIFARRKEIVREIIVKHLGHFRRQLFHHLVGLGLEVLPELGEQLLVILTPVRNGVELILHPGGEVICDIGREKAFEEGRQKAPGFLGKEAALLHPHIVAVAQCLNGRGIG